MTREELRLECLRLAVKSMPATGMPGDRIAPHATEEVVRRAEAYFAFVMPTESSEDVS